MEEKQDYRILEINLISAQDLKTPATKRRKIQTYAVVWVDDSSMKLRTRTDCFGAENPTWNDKFLFRVSPDFIDGATSGINVQIYSVRRLKDALVGTARCLLHKCLGKFTSAYVHRPSGNFHGILNVAAALCDVENIGADSDIFRGSPMVSFHDLTREKPEKERDDRSLMGRLRLGRSSPSLSTMSLPATSPTRSFEVSSLRTVKSDPSVLTTPLSTEWNDVSTSASSPSFLSTLSDDIESRADRTGSGCVPAMVRGHWRKKNTVNC